MDTLSACTSTENVKQWEIDRQTFERDRITDPKVADAFFKQDLTQGMLECSRHIAWTYATAIL